MIKKVLCICLIFFSNTLTEPCYLFLTPRLLGSSSLQSDVWTLINFICQMALDLLNMWNQFVILSKELFKLHLEWFYPPSLNLPFFVCVCVLHIFGWSYIFIWGLSINLSAIQIFIHWNNNILNELITARTTKTNSSYHIVGVVQRPVDPKVRGSKPSSGLQFEDL